MSSSASGLSAVPVRSRSGRLSANGGIEGAIVVEKIKLQTDRELRVQRGDRSI